MTQRAEPNSRSVMAILSAIKSRIEPTGLVCCIANNFPEMDIWFTADQWLGEVSIKATKIQIYLAPFYNPSEDEHPDLSGGFDKTTLGIYDMSDPDFEIEDVTTAILMSREVFNDKLNSKHLR